MVDSWHGASTKYALVRQLRDYLHRSLSLSGNLHSHRSTPVSPHLCHRDASLRCQFSCSDEITRPRFSEHDDALYRGGVERSPEGVSTGSFKTSAPGSSAENVLAPIRTGLDGVIDSLQATQHALEMFRRALPIGAARSCLDRLSNRLTKIITEARKLRTP